ncbi:exocyst complex component Sec6-domain-containing protein [Blastocladiella britannica]|nr:exocyst complex component Sec6-domain-containing protein [Blastocladiella britannica]
MNKSLPPQPPAAATAPPSSAQQKSQGGGVIPGNRSLSSDEAAAHALERLVFLLRYPDDLHAKLDDLRKATAADKAAVDAQLKSATQSQLNDCQTGLDNLSAARSHLDSGRKMLAGVHANGVKSIGMIPSFTRVQRISLVHRNFQATQQTLAHFQALNDRVDRLRATLDAHHRDLLGGAPELIAMHHELFQLEAFRDATLAQVRGASDDTVNTVRAYFRRLDELSDQFSDYLWDLARHALDLVRAHQPGVVVRMAKILEFEERADEEELAARERDATGSGGADTSMVRSESTTSVGTSSVGGGTAARAGGRTRRHREIRSYRSKFFDVVHEAITQKFTAVFDPSVDVPAMLIAAREMVLADLTFVFDELVDLFPKKYKLFPFYVLEYHRHVYDLINKIILEKMETGTILFILRWCGEYYGEMDAKLGVAEELLEPRLLDGQERVLVEDYLKLIRSKLDEWLKNLLNAETRDYVDRPHPPETDSQGMYLLSASVILFNMVNQQIDVVLDSSRGQLLLDVVKECTKALTGYQQHFLQLAQSEAAKYAADPQRSNPGLIEYTMALANDSLKCTEFVELLIARLEQEADYTYRAPITAEFNAAMDGFMRVAKVACTILIDSSFADIKSAFVVLFTAPAWYEGEIMSDIIATLNDYCVDYREHLLEYLFGKLITDIMERFAVSWIDAMRAKSAKLRVSQPATWDLLASDYKRVIDFFGQYKSQKRVEKHFDVIDKIFTVLCSNKKMVYLDFYSLTKAYSDVPLPFMEDLLAKRDDLDKASLKEVIEGLRAKAKQQQQAMLEAGEGAVFGEKSVFSVVFPPVPPSAAPGISK